MFDCGINVYYYHSCIPTFAGCLQRREQTSCDRNLPIDTNPAYGFQQVGVQQDGNSTVMANESQAMTGVASEPNAIYEVLPE